MTGHDWYDQLAALGQRCIVILVPGTIAGQPVTGMFAAPLYQHVLAHAFSEQPAARVGLMVGACQKLHEHYERAYGMRQLEPKA